MTAVLDEQLLERLREQGDQPVPLLLELGPDTRSCVVCSSTYHRRPRVSRASFATRQACGTSCARWLRARGPRVPVGEKTCPVCSSTFSRPTGVGRQEWADRRFCSRRCGAIHQHASRPRSDSPRKRGPVEVRMCTQCGSEFTRRVGSENRARFATRETCSRTCASRRKAAAILPATGERTCEYEQCRVVFQRKPRGESPKQWGKRRFCSPVCASTARRRAANGKSLPKMRRQPSKPQPAPPLPLPVVQPQRPVWRPGGWTAEPQVHGAGAGR